LLLSIAHITFVATPPAHKYPQRCSNTSPDPWVPPRWRWLILRAAPLLLLSSQCISLYRRRHHLYSSPHRRVAHLPCLQRPRRSLSTPIFSLPSNIGVCEKAVNSFSPALRGVSPTSVATSLATPRMGGISRGPRLPGGIVDIRRSYDRGSPSSEKVFEPVDRESQRRVPMPMPMTCSPCRNINQDDTADVDVSSPIAAASVASSPHITGSAPFLKLRKGGDRLGGSSNRSSHGRRRAPTSTMSPASASPTPQNLKDNPERLAKVKTEMCRYYELGGLKNCPWGDKCKFEHVHTRYHCDV